MQPGSHGSTFGGNPLACAAGLATVETIVNEALVDRARETGNYLKQQLTSKLADCTNVKEIRGQGLMLGIELKAPCTELVDLAVAKGLLINVTAGSVIRLLPPLNITKEDTDKLVEILTELIHEN